MDMNSWPQRPLVSLLGLACAGGLGGLALLVAGVRGQAEAGALLAHAGAAPADEDHQHEDDERHHARRDHRPDHDHVGVRDVLQDPDALDVDLTGDAQAHAVVHVTVISSEALLIEAQLDRAFKAGIYHFTVKCLVSFLPGK